MNISEHYKLLNNMNINKGKNDYCKSFIKLYLDGIGPLEKLTAEEERKLFYEYKSGRKNAFNELLFKNQYIVIEEVLKFVRQGVELLDLIQNANLGCIISLKKYTPEKVGLKNYLHRNIYRHLQNTTPGFYSIIRYPANILHDFWNMYIINKSEDKNKAENKLDKNFIKLTPLRFLKFDNDKLDFNLYTLQVDLDLESIPQNLYPSVNNHLDYESLKYEIYLTLNSLKERERKIIKWYFGIDIERPLNFEEIGQKLELSRERVRQLKEEVLKTLSKPHKKKNLHKYLSIFDFESINILYKENDLIYPGLNIDDEISAIKMLREYIEPSRRRTSYPKISNLSKTCREYIIKILRREGQPCSYRMLKEEVHKKYPLFKAGTFEYSIRTSEDVVNIHKGLYALKEWVFEKDPEGNTEVKFPEKEKKVVDKELELKKLLSAIIKFTDPQLKMINYFLKNKGQLSKLKITVFSRSNNFNVHEVINCINKKFVENFREPLIKEENSIFLLNNKFLN